jgi:hypothetical protein
MCFVGGVFAVFGAGTFFVRSQMMARRDSDYLREIGKAWRSMVREWLWIGAVLLLLGLVLFLFGR